MYKNFKDKNLTIFTPKMNNFYIIKVCVFVLYNESFEFFTHINI